MVFWQTDVLIQMEKVDLAPVDVLFFRQGGQHFELAGASCDDYIGMAVFRDCLADVSGAFRSRRLTERVFVVKNFDFHFSPFLLVGGLLL